MGAAAMLIAGGLQGGSALAQGIQANKEAKADAQAVMGSGRLEADRIRKLGERQRSSARAALAANGVKVDEGMGDMIQTDITQRSEQDALTAVLNASYQARKIRAEGRNALVGSVLRGAGQAASAYGGWKAQTGAPADAGFSGGSGYSNMGDWSAGSAGGYA